MASASRSKRVSEFYALGVNQPSLEFLDVELDTDTRLFVDPTSVKLLDNDWGNSAREIIDSYFKVLVAAVKARDSAKVRMLLAGFHEPNETRLGHSAGTVDGKGIGNGLIDQLHDALMTSEAIHEGLMVGLEDFAMLVPSIQHDRISDVTTNLVRPLLAEFTAGMAEKYGMSGLESRNVGPVWDPDEQQWISMYVPTLAPSDAPLLLVPRSVVRWTPLYDPGDYYRHAVLTFLQERELENSHSRIVHIPKSGRYKGERRVTKRAIASQAIRKYGPGEKNISVKATKEFPEILARYHHRKSGQVARPMSAEALHLSINTPTPDWDKLLRDVKSVKPGRAGATTYHRAVEALLTALFDSSLTDPETEVHTTGDTQRIDIRYLNRAQGGFFSWYRENYGTAAYVPFECKNYKSDVSNTEIAQIASRLGSRTGKLGFLVFRTLDDRDRFLDRTAGELNNRGNHIIGLTDDDFDAMVRLRKRGHSPTDRLFALFKELVDK